MCSHYSTQRTNILDVLSTFIWDSYSYSFNRHRLQLHTTCRKILMKWVTTFPSKKINSYSIFTHPPANVCTWASDKKLKIHRNLRSPWRRYYYRYSVPVPRKLEVMLPYLFFLIRHLSNIFLLRSVRRQRGEKKRWSKKTPNHCRPFKSSSLQSVQSDVPQGRNHWAPIEDGTQCLFVSELVWHVC